MNVVFLFDVDNTLLDNDRVAADLRTHLDAEVGPDCGRHYWQIFEQIREELGYADYLGALQRYRQLNPRDLRVLAVSHFLVSYPFANRLFPGSLDALDVADVARYPTPDLTIERIGDLVEHHLAGFLAAAGR